MPLHFFIVNGRFPIVLSIDRERYNVIIYVLDARPPPHTPTVLLYYLVIISV